MKKVIIIILICAIIIAGFFLGMKLGGKNAETTSANTTNTTTAVEENVAQTTSNTADTAKNESTNTNASSNTSKVADNTNTSSSSSKMSDEEYYEKAAEFVKQERLKDEDDVSDKQDYQKFVEYDGFGVGEENGVTYAYMWIGDSSYYIENGELQTGPGASMAYKVKFKDGEAVSYENPTDGAGQEADIKKMFPKDVASKILTYNFDFTRLDNAAKKYYNK